MSYRFGIIGLGMVADVHAKAMQAMENGELVACYSRTQAKADAFAQKYQCTGYADLQAFLAHPGLDIVSICTPSGSHLEPAVAAAKAGKHLIIEKPLEITLERCDQIIETCQQYQVTLAGVFQSRFLEAARVVKKAIDEDRFGRLVLGDAYVKWFRSQEYYDQGGWHGTWELDGGGALINQSIHAIDLLQWFMGTVKAVSAFTGTLGHEGVEVEDAAVATLHFKNGALGVIVGTTAIYPGFPKRIEISGTQGSAFLEEETLRAWNFVTAQEEDEKILKKFGPQTGATGGAADPGAIKFQGHQRQFEDLVEAIEIGRKPLIDGLEARKAVEIVLAIYQSAHEGKKMTLPLS